MSKNQWVAALEKVTLKKLCENREYIKTQPRRDYLGREVISVDDSDTIRHTVQVLTKNRIGSVPVVAAPPQQAEEFYGEVAALPPGKFQGFVDMLDVAAFIAMSSPTSGPMEAETLARAARLLEAPVHHLISQKAPALPCYEGHSGLDALKILATGIHRVPLFNDQKMMTGLCSQTDLVRFLHHHFQAGKLDGSKCNLREFIKAKPSGPGVLSIFPSATVLHALTKMATSGARALAVVSPKDGSLVGHFSATDIGQAFGPALDPVAIYAAFLLPVAEYQARFCTKALTAVFELPSVSLQRVCQEMIQNHVHQLWIVNDNDKKDVCGVVTMSDVCRYVLQAKAIH